MNILYFSIGCFALAAILGIYMLAFVMKGAHPPKPIAFAHGGLAVVGLLSLVFDRMSAHGGFLVPIVLFSTAAVGGLVMISLHLSGRKIPTWGALGHGLIAVTAFVALLLESF